MQAFLLTKATNLVKGYMMQLTMDVEAPLLATTDGAPSGSCCSAGVGLSHLYISCHTARAKCSNATRVAPNAAVPRWQLMVRAMLRSTGCFRDARSLQNSKLLLFGKKLILIQMEYSSACENSGLKILEQNQGLC